MDEDSLLPANEAERLQALYRYGVLDTPGDGAFDHVTALAARLFQVPIAIVSLVDRDRIWFAARHGLTLRETGRAPGLCASAILSPEVYHVIDAAQDARALANPLVAGKEGFRFYAAAPLRTRDGFNLGTLCIIDRAPRELEASEAALLQSLAAIVVQQMELRLAARHIAELEEAHRAIGAQLRESEARYRDLFDEAPIAYVHEALDSRLLRANRTALRILGLAADEVAATYGSDLVPDTPEAQRRLREALDAIGRGAETEGVVLELRRRDGRPLWVQWWSRPDPAAGFTRTMFLDVTARVQMEQQHAQLQAQNEYLLEELRGERGIGQLVGDSPALQRVLRQLELVAPTDTTVLITGESGTGKELVARALHDRSRRRGRAIVRVNCTAVPDGLFESEFFGHVRGAFTGALRDKPGRFELADGGTLFLDEIGEIPLALQAKLLRVLQEQEIERVGDTRTRRVDVRVIAATNRDLRAEVEAGRFRRDLFYRLGVFPIEIPPLRERRGDVATLARHFVHQGATRLGMPVPPLPPAAIERLAAHDWPGNVRELQNAVDRALILSRGGPLCFDLPAPTAPAAVPAAPVAPAPPAPHAMLTRSELKQRERDSIVAALARSGGKVFGRGGAAELLDMKPTTLASRISALGLAGPPRRRRLG